MSTNSQIKLNIPTRTEIIKDTIEKYGGEVEITANSIYVKRQPKCLRNIASLQSVKLRIRSDKTFLIDLVGSTYTPASAIEYANKIQKAVAIINEINGLQEVYQKIVSSTEERNKK